MWLLGLSFAVGFVLGCFVTVMIIIQTFIRGL